MCGYLVQVLNTDYSALVAASCMNRLAKLSARFIGNRGFSIGIDDVTPAPRLVEKKQQTVSTGYDKVQAFIRDFSKGQLKLEPGCNPEESLESVVTGVLNNIREEAAQVRESASVLQSVFLTLQTICCSRSAQVSWDWHMTCQAGLYRRRKLCQAFVHDFCICLM